MSIFKAMKAKKKRAVDPNAPPRPNLMTHEVKLRDAQQNVDILTRTIVQQEERLRSLESKVRYQTGYLQILHSKLSKK